MRVSNNSNKMVRDNIIMRVISIRGNSRRECKVGWLSRGISELFYLLK